MIELSIENEQEAIELPEMIEERLQQLSDLVAESEQLMPGEVSVLFVTNESIRKWNHTYRGLDRATDVLSFAMNESAEEELEITFVENGEGSLLPVLYGDIIISVERAQEQAEQYGHSLLREICFLYIHGFFHLLGYDHQTEADEQLMIAKQQSILSKAGIER